MIKETFSGESLIAQSVQKQKQTSKSGFRSFKSILDLNNSTKVDLRKWDIFYDIPEIMPNYVARRRQHLIR